MTILSLCLPDPRPSWRYSEMLRANCGAGRGGSAPWPRRCAWTQGAAVCTARRKTQEQRTSLFILGPPHLPPPGIVSFRPWSKRSRHWWWACCKRLSSKPAARDQAHRCRCWRYMWLSSLSASLLATRAADSSYSDPQFQQPSTSRIRWEH